MKIEIETNLQGNEYVVLSNANNLPDDLYTNKYSNDKIELINKYLNINLISIFISF